MLSLARPWPNPTAASVLTVGFATDRERWLDVAVYDVAGGLVARLGARRPFGRGAHEMRLDLPPTVRNGVYFLALLELATPVAGARAPATGYRVLGARRLIVRR